MSGISRIDAKRRLVLPKDFVDEYGDEFVIIKIGDELILKPLPKDPIATLRKEGKKFKGMTSKKLRREFEESLTERIK